MDKQISNSIYKYGDESEQAKIAGARIKQLRKTNNDSVTGLAKEIGIHRRTLEGYEKGASFPPVHVLLKLCNRYDCELEYLLGFQEHKKKVLGSVTDITGLSEEVVQHLVNDLGTTKEALDESNVRHKDHYLVADHFLQYLILHERETKLFDRISNESLICHTTEKIEENKRSIKFVEEAYDQAERMTLFNNPFLKLVGGEQISGAEEAIFYSFLRAKLCVDDEGLDRWIEEEFLCDKEFLYRAMTLKRTRIERLRVIEDCFTEIVKRYLEEE